MNARVVQYRFIDRSRPVFLPDGRNAQELRFKELLPLLRGIPGLNLSPTAGKAEALDALEALTLQRAQTIAGASWREPPPEGLMRQAAAQIGGAA